MLIEVARFQSGVGVVRLDYDPLTFAITAIEADVAAGALTLTLMRKNGQSRSVTLGPGSHRSTNIPPGAQLDQTVDAEAGGLAITMARRKSNIVLTCSWSA